MKILADEAEKIYSKACEALDKNQFKKSFELMLLAAKSGNVNAKVNVGCFYFDGVGHPTDTRLGLKWSRAAYIDGIAYAATNIAIFFHKNLLNYKRAEIWFKKAIGKNDDSAKLYYSKLLIERNRKNSIDKALILLQEAVESEFLFGDEFKEAQEILAKLTTHTQQDTQITEPDTPVLL